MRSMKSIIAASYKNWDEPKYQDYMERFRLSESQKIETLSKVSYLFGKNVVAVTPALSNGVSLLLILLGIMVLLVSVKLSVHFLKKGQ